MSILLLETLSVPLEREHEAWIVRQIEDYFSDSGRRVKIWAVSPSDEKTWPADEHLAAEGKLVGLQFKRAHVATGSNPIDLSRLKWSFASPPGQFELIQRRPEIFYCLPTFINRQWQRAALQHCLFWRPEPTDPTDLNAWYENPGALTPYNALGAAPLAYRWGRFYELLSGCRIGKKIGLADETLPSYLAGLRSDSFRRTESALAALEASPSDVLYLALVPID